MRPGGSLYVLTAFSIPDKRRERGAAGLVAPRMRIGLDEYATRRVPQVSAQRRNGTSRQPLAAEAVGACSLHPQSPARLIAIHP